MICGGADFGKFAGKKVKHVPLLRGRGGRRADLIALAVDGGIADEAGFKFGVEIGHGRLRIFGDLGRGRVQSQRRIAGWLGLCDRSAGECEPKLFCRTGRAECGVAAGAWRFTAALRGMRLQRASAR